MEYLLIIVLFMLFWILENKRLVNIKAIFDCVFYMLLIVLELIIFIFCIMNLITIFDKIGILLFGIVISIFIILLIGSICLLRGHINGGFRTIYYLININKFLNNGKVFTGKIIDVKYDAQSRLYKKRYLIVSVEGSTIKSTYYLDDKYKIGKNIKVVKYKNKYLILV